MNLKTKELSDVNEQSTDASKQTIEEYVTSKFHSLPYITVKSFKLDTEPENCLYLEGLFRHQYLVERVSLLETILKKVIIKKNICEEIILERFKDVDKVKELIEKRFSEADIPDTMEVDFDRI